MIIKFHSNAKLLLSACLTGLLLIFPIKNVDASADSDLSHQRIKYDARDRIVAIEGPGERNLRIQYNERGQIDSISKGKNTENYLYDRLGYLKNFKDSTGTTQLKFESSGRLESMIYPGGEKISYQYNTTGALEAVSLGDQLILSYKRDLFGNPVEISTEAGKFKILYDYNKRVQQRKYPNGAFSRFEFNVDGKVEKIIHALESGEVFLKFEYKYNDAGLLREVQESSRQGKITITYSYDAYGQLIKAVYSDGRVYQYKYDIFGNLQELTSPLLKTTLNYYPNDQLKSINGKEVIHDTAGSIIRLGGASYTFNEDNALIKEGSTTYQYNALGLRVVRSGKQGNTNFVHLIQDLPYVLMEKGKLNKKYLWADGKLLGQIANNKEALFFFEDHLGSIRAAVGMSGDIIGFAEYSPFGNPLKRIPNVSYGYAGEEQDENGKVYLRARYYDPKIARFLSKDPVLQNLFGSPKQNLYAYVGNSPTNFVDNNGRERISTSCINGNSCRTPTHKEVFDFLKYFLKQPEINPAVLSTHSGEEQIIWPMDWDVQDVVLPDGQEYDMNHLVTALSVPHVGVTVVRSTALIGWLSGGMVINTIKLDPAGGYRNLMNNLRGNKLGYQLRKMNRDVVERGEESIFYTPTFGKRLKQNKVQRDANYMKIRMRWEGLQQQKQKNQQQEIKSNTIDPTSSVIDRQDIMQQSKALADHMMLSINKYQAVVEKYDISSGLGRTASASGSSGFAGPGAISANKVVQSMQRPGTPNVGGVYLDKAAEFVGNLSSIEGVSFDPVSNRLILVGNDGSSTKAPPLNIEDLATAYRSVFGDLLKDPGVTIDPNPRNPRAEKMLVRFFGGVENTRFGLKIFEADRQMKGLSLGEDNISHEKIKANVKGYYNLVDLGFSNLAGEHNEGLWSRFWLVPEKVIVQVAEDKKSIFFPETKIRIKTETMRWESGKLVPEKNQKNEKAEYFAGHFTKYYDEYAKEFPVYKELKELTNIIALMKWIKESGLPVKLDWLDQYYKEYKTPTTTPSLTTSGERKDGNTVKTISIFGGTDLTVENFYVEDDSTAKKYAKASLKAISDTVGLGVGKFKAKDDSVKIVIAMPTSESRGVGAMIISENELGLLSRVFCSFHNESGEFGNSWYFDLPKLHISRPHHNKIESIAVNGQEVVKKNIRITRPFGMLDVQFGQPTMDQKRQRIAFLPKSRAGVYALYPTKNGHYQVEYEDGRKEIFNTEGKIVKSSVVPTVYQAYKYNKAGKLSEVSLVEGNKSVLKIKLFYDKAGRVQSADAGGEKVNYVYNKKNELTEVNLKKEKTEYLYNNRHLVTEVKLNGKTISSFKYGNYGRLESWKDQKETSNKIAYQNKGSETVVTQGSGENKVTRRYDAGGRLLYISYGTGEKIRGHYRSDGTLEKQEIVNQFGDKQIIEYSLDGMYTKYIDPENTAKGILLDEYGRLKKIDDGEYLLMEKKYGRSKEGWLETTETSDFTSQIVYDDNNRLKLQSINGNFPTVGQVQFQNSYDGKGSLVSRVMSGMQDSEKNFNNGKLSQYKIGNEITKYQYNRNGNLIGFKSGSRNTKLDYDKNGLLKKIKYKYGKHSDVYKYNNGNLIERINSEGLKDEFSYGKNDLLNSLSREDGEKWIIARKDKRVTVNRNGRKHLEFSYDEKGRLAELAY